VEQITGERVKYAIVDRGYPGPKKINNTTIVRPSKYEQKHNTAYQRNKARKQFRRRAAIEPIIGHVKHDHRMIRNYLKGAMGNELNLLLAATGFNLKKRLNQIKEQIIFWYKVFFYPYNIKLS